MPLSPMGIVHTIVGIVAIVSVIMLLWKDKQISYKPLAGKVYLLATLITAGSALTIFKHGGFNVAHALGVLTILAVLTGAVLEKTTLFKSWNGYFVNLCYSATVLFHALPTATEIMTRFPMNAPIASSLKDPILEKTFQIILLVFLVMLTLQMIWLYKQSKR